MHGLFHGKGAQASRNICCTGSFVKESGVHCRLIFNPMIDKDGFRANVGIILCNRQNLVLWARRAGQQDWQFPQGGINKDETTEAAMYRELKEEIGLMPGHVEVLGRTRDWLTYKIPEKYRRTSRSKPLTRTETVLVSIASDRQ